MPQGYATRRLLLRFRPALPPANWRVRLARFWCWLKPPRRADYSGLVQDCGLNIPGPMNLGTPAERIRSRHIAWWRNLKEALVLGAVFCAGMVIGADNDPRTLEERVQAAQARASRYAHHVDAGTLSAMAQGKYRIAYDPHEDCVVIRHKNGLGEVVTHNHC